MLLWKEWRQQRWTLAGMLALALALVVAGGMLRRWSFVLSGAASVFVLLGLPLVLSARAFAGEDEDGTATFLRELPFRPLQVFAAKFLVVVLASWSAAGVLLAFGALWPGYPDDALRGIPMAVRHKAGYVGTVIRVGIWLLAPVVSSLASLLASLGLRSLTTALLSCVCLCLSVWGGALSLFFLGGVAQARGFVWASAAAVVPSLGVLLAAGLSARRHPNRLVQFLRGAGGATAVTALWLVPGILSVLYLVALATPEAYLLRPTWWRDPLGRVTVSVPPTVRPTAVLLVCQHSVLRSTSLALLDPATGRTTWTGRAIPWADLRKGRWSPGGTRLALLDWDVTGLGLDWGWWDASLEELGRQSRSPQNPRVSVYDTATGRTTRVPGDPRPGWIEEEGDLWYNDTWLAERQGSGTAAHWWPSAIGFLNVEDGTTRVCRLPLDDGENASWRWAGKVVVPGQAVFAALQRGGTAGAASEAVVARCTPADEVATLVPIVNLPERWEGGLLAVNQGARWALFGNAESIGGHIQDWHLVDLTTGRRRQVELPPALAERQAEPGGSLSLVGFAGATGRLLMGTRDLLAVYDPEGGAWEVYAPPPPDGPRAGGYGWSPSPDGEHFLQVWCAHDSSPTVARVFDLGSGQWSVLPLGKGWYGDVQWYGNQHVVGQSNGRLWKLGLDGSREVLWPRE
jgi:hypothetical protein